jgi:hypothetical protein
VIEADPQAVDALWSGIASDLELMPDPLERYHQLTADLAVWQEIVMRLAAERDACVLAFHRRGSSYA